MSPQGSSPAVSSPPNSGSGPSLTSVDARGEPTRENATGSTSLSPLIYLPTRENATGNSSGAGAEHIPPLQLIASKPPVAPADERIGILKPWVSLAACFGMLQLLMLINIAHPHGHFRVLAQIVGLSGMFLVFVGAGFGSAIVSGFISGKRGRSWIEFGVVFIGMLLVLTCLGIIIAILLSPNAGTQ